MSYDLYKFGRFRRRRPIYNQSLPLRKGALVKLIFKVHDNPEVSGERLWVEIIDVNGRSFTGRIDNDPIHIKARYGDTVTFKKNNIFDVYED